MSARRRTVSGVGRILAFPLVVLVTLYRWFLSPLLHTLVPGSGCRFEPTCSRYALQALQEHGPLYGSWLAIRRLSRCHPWGGCGFDPVPPRASASQPPERPDPQTLAHHG
ncbi:MAG: membrane protein insertion efficiency factor YidD [Verrucomicrobiota bacterium JB022]|nr:membrane protein insertion efficiency factor YidD [Verrucomicrobiota bacterium JB022]